MHMLHYIRLHEPDYPTSILRHLGQDAPSCITALGNLDILQRKTVALFCSIKCPGDVIVRTYDLARVLRDAGVTVIGGFHTPMEQECLALLLRGSQPLIVCPARGIGTMRIPVPWREPIAEGRLLLLSPFDDKHHRVTAALAHQRNRWVAALAVEIIVAYASAGSNTETLACEALASGKPVYTLPLAVNQGLVQHGAQAIDAGLWHTRT